MHLCLLTIYSNSFVIVIAVRDCIYSCTACKWITRCLRVNTLLDSNNDNHTHVAYNCHSSWQCNYLQTPHVILNNTYSVTTIQHSTMDVMMLQNAICGTRYLSSAPRNVLAALVKFDHTIQNTLVINETFIITLSRGSNRVAANVIHANL